MNILEDGIRTFIAVLLLPGYCKAPYWDLYWADTPDTQNEAVSCAMSRNIVQEILSNLHLADNTQITEDRYYKVRVLFEKDRYYKVRVLFEKLNFNFKQYGSFVNQSVDESVIPYYGKHCTKQFIRGNPIRFGFKLWCIISSERYLLMQNHTKE